MRDIYSGAAVVWVWLGKGTPETDSAFTHLSELDTIFPQKPDPTFSKSQPEEFHELRRRFMSQ
jgi:hypothetical protein